MNLNGSAAISKAAELQPDVILLDINLPDMNGQDVARRMKVVAPSTEMLLLSEHDLLPMVKEGLRGGNQGGSHPTMFRTVAPLACIRAVALSLNFSFSLFWLRFADRPRTDPYERVHAYVAQLRIIKIRPR